MKPVYKCDYCSHMGTEEEVKEHELKCTDNYDRRSCFTCKNKMTKVKDGEWYYECEAGIEIPAGKIYEYCGSYDRKVKGTFDNLGDIFGTIFGDKR